MPVGDVLERVSVEEFFDWWSYFMLEDDKYYNKIKRQINYEDNKVMTKEQRHNRIRDMFRSLQNREKEDNN